MILLPCGGLSATATCMVAVDLCVCIAPRGCCVRWCTLNRWGLWGLGCKMQLRGSFPQRLLVLAAVAHLMPCACTKSTDATMTAWSLQQACRMDTVICRAFAEIRPHILFAFVRLHHTLALCCMCEFRALLLVEMCFTNLHVW